MTRTRPPITPLAMLNDKKDGYILRLDPEAASQLVDVMMTMGGPWVTLAEQIGKMWKYTHGHELFQHKFRRGSP